MHPFRGDAVGKVDADDATPRQVMIAATPQHGFHRFHFPLPFVPFFATSILGRQHEGYLHFADPLKPVQGGYQLLKRVFVLVGNGME
jgi:hypothetical protein